MADDSHILELVEEALCSDLTPEEVCANDPELLTDVRTRLDECRRVDLMFDVIFPPTPAPKALGHPLHSGAALPEIPGYEVLAVLGRGGHGIVYRVRHLKLKRVAALKMLVTGQYASMAELARFMREAEAIAALQHPNIVQIYEIGEVDGRPYFTMELVSGGSLAQKLEGVPQPAQYAASVTECLARAIHTSHLVGIIHRDVKPSNVLLTLDESPKISDFGLARYFVGCADVTLGPAKVGTPSYMAPEQVVGNPGSVGPSADIYAIGATLYELLTGRPPFRGETATETERQLLTREPVPPSQLNPKVPRDLETICLKCLQKEPTRRYENALALADDLRRFKEGRPIHARPAGRGERAWRWCRRNPTMAALLITALALVGLASGGGTWFLQQRTRQNTEMRSEVTTNVTQAVSLRKGFHFNEARALLEQASHRLQSGGSDELRQQVQQAQADLALAQRLDSARSRGAALEGGKFDPSGSEPLYASAFADAGLGQGQDAKVVAAKVRASAVRAEIVTALDGWASITTDRKRQAWLLEVARESDSDPARNRLRQPELWRDPGALTREAEKLPAAELTPQLVIAASRVAREGGVDPVPLLMRAQDRFPQDFWINNELGLQLHEAGRNLESLTFYRVARALRPDSSGPYEGLGADLRRLGRLDEAADHLQDALRLDPGYSAAHGNLAQVLEDKGRVDEAISQYQQSIDAEPGSAVLHSNLGLALLKKGRLDEALDELQQAAKLAPDSAPIHSNLGYALYRKGRRDEAIRQYRQAIDIDPNLAVAHLSFGMALRDMGKLDEAIEHDQQAVNIEPGKAWNHLVLADALKDKGRMDEAFAQYEQALKIQPQSGHIHNNFALALYAAGRREEAILHYRQAVSIDPEGAAAHMNLGLALRDMGKLDEAIEHLQQAVNIEPRSTLAHNNLALALRSKGRREEAISQYQKILSMDPNNVPASVNLGRAQSELHIAHRQWTQATECYARSLSQAPTDDGQFWFEYAAVSLLSGDRSGYTRACTHMVEAFGKPGGPRAYHIARACTLGSDAMKDSSLPGRLAENELRQSAEKFWSLTEQGAVACRAGRFEEARSLFDKSLKSDSHAGRAVVNWVWLAIAEQRLGHSDEARRWLEKTQTWLDQYHDGVPPEAEAETGLHLHNWLEANVLRREAEALIPPT